MAGADDLPLANAPNALVLSEKTSTLEFQHRASKESLRARREIVRYSCTLVCSV
jgi:hypothetical protein